jgi:serralysin
MAEVNEDRWCFAWFADAQPTSESTRAALVKGNKWQSGDTITISFLDGDERQKGLVRRHAVEWVTGLANLNFSWQNPPNSDIRISFSYRGSWSVVGTTCRSVMPKTKPTMNFGWLTPDLSDDDARQVILHEFGHALGLIHEHQNPVGQIQWNKPVVISDLQGPPNEWDLATIQDNMFDAYPPNEIAGTKLDATSIMMYPLPKSWTLDGTSAGMNRELSATDKVFIKQQYS